MAELKVNLSVDSSEVNAAVEKVVEAIKALDHAIANIKVNATPVVEE